MVRTDELQMELMPRRGTIDAIFILRQVLEKYEIAGGKLFVVFVNLEKAFDRVSREVIWWILRRKGVVERELTITEMYKNIITSVRIVSEGSEEFDVKVGVHQASVLSSILFAIVMNKITKDATEGSAREGGAKEPFYADGLVLLRDSWKEVEKRSHDGKEL